MKPFIFSNIVLFVLGLYACGGSSEPNEARQAPKIQNQETVSCYRYKSGNDTIELQLNIVDNNKVIGKLRYDFYEKDGSSGTISGTWVGDTIMADYVFMSEGVESESEVVLLKKEDGYGLGYGEGDVVNGKWVFTNRGQLNFEDIQLKKVDCGIGQ